MSAGRNLNAPTGIVIRKNVVRNRVRARIDVQTMIVRVVVGNGRSRCRKTPDVDKLVAIESQIARGRAGINPNDSVTLGSLRDGVVSVPDIVKVVPDELNMVIVRAIHHRASP